MAYLSELAAGWGSVYANHAALRSRHLRTHGMLIVGGGAGSRPIARRSARSGPTDRTANSLDMLHGTHRVVIVSLVLVAIDVLMFTADVDSCSTRASSGSKWGSSLSSS